MDESIISAAQGLLKMQSPHVGSLQLPFLATTKAALEPQGGEFVQILNINGKNWITIYKIGGKDGHFKPSHTRLPADTKSVVADLPHHTGNAITLHYCDVQWQSGSDDCGLFAIAFGVTLCSGENPANKTFNQSKMKAHLKKLIKRNLLPFLERVNWGKCAIKPAKEKFSPPFVCTNSLM